MPTVAVAAIGLYSAKRSADKKASAAKKAGNLQLYQYEQTREDTAPWREMGGRAVGKMEQLVGTDGKFDPSLITEQPGYQFRLNEMVKGMDRSASAAGRLDSGRYGKELGRYLQDYASTEYNNVYSRLANMAGLGANQTTSTAQIGQNAASSAGRYIQSAGDAGASGTLGQGVALNNAIQGGYANYLYQQNMNQGVQSAGNAMWAGAMQGAGGF